MFIEQAYKGDNAAYKVIITSLISMGIFIINFIYFVFFSSPSELKELYALMNNIPKSVSLVLNLLPFAFLLLLLFILVYFLHNRSIVSLTTARPKVDFSRIAFAFFLVIAFTVIPFGISYYADSSNIVWNFDPLKFGILVLISLLLFPLQIGFEEYLFRGFLMQQIGVAVRNRYMPLIITSVLFGIFHSANPEVAEMGYGVMAFYIGTGLLLGIMTLMDDGLELALGFHLGNNLMAALLITSDFSALQTDALFRYTTNLDTSSMLSEMIVSIAFTYPLILLILAKRYRWTSWKDRLFGKVAPPVAQKI